MPDQVNFQHALGGAPELLQARLATQWPRYARNRRPPSLSASRWAARLTLSALPEADREAMVEDWALQGCGSSSSLHGGADALLDFIAGRLEEPSHAASLCRFERALIRARTARPDDHRPGPLNAMSLVQRSESADLVHFHAPVEALRSAIEGKRAWPHVGQIAHSLLVAPRITGQVRDASAVEVALWESAEQPVPAAIHWPTARSLVACSVLKIVPEIEI